ncbi:hypothetical protein Peur_056442 [Populus x canadensis]
MHSKLVKRRAWAVNKQKTGLQRSFYFKFKLPTSSSSPVTLDNPPPRKIPCRQGSAMENVMPVHPRTPRWHRLVVRCSMQNRLGSLHRVVSRVHLKLRYMEGRVDLC